MSDCSRRLSLSWKSVACAVVLVVSVPHQASAQISLIDEIYDLVNEVRSRVETAISQAQAARSAAEEVRTQVRSGVSYMTPQLTEFIVAAVNEGKDLLATEWAGLEAFAPGGTCSQTCAAFRRDLVELLTVTGELTRTVLVALEAPANPDLARLVELVEAAPPRTLYPIFRILEEVLASDLPEHFSAIIPDTAFVIGIAIQVRQEDFCAAAVMHTDRIQSWSTTAMKGSILLTVIGKLLNALGTTEIEATAGAAGFAGGTIKANKVKKLAEVVTGVGTVLDKVSTFATTKTRFCLIYQFQDETRATLASMSATLAGLNFELSNLDAPVSSRATQASVDDVHATLRGVAADVSVLVDGQGGGSGGSGGSSLILRVQIEQQLGSKDALAVFYLPESFGGLLERVREVVSDNLAQHQAAGLPTGDAWRLLRRGDAAVAAFDYRTSYAWYQSAYQKLTTERHDRRDK